jgi:hypothetical protein
MIMRIRTSEVVRALWQASRRDPGNPLLGTDRDGSMKKTRVVVMKNGSVEITDMYDQRGKDEGVICYINPHQYGSLLVHKTPDEAVADRAYHEAVGKEILKAGGEIITDV